MVGKPPANLTLVVYSLLNGYHEFKIKEPEGTPFHVLPENGNKDPFALHCVLPEIREIHETLLDVPQSGIKER